MLATLTRQWPRRVVGGVGRAPSVAEVSHLDGYRLLSHQGRLGADPAAEPLAADLGVPAAHRLDHIATNVRKSWASTQLLNYPNLQKACPPV